MKHFIAHYKYHILILVLGFLWIELFNYILQVHNQGIICLDSKSYVNSAKNLYLLFRGHLTRPIGMAFITGIPLIFGASDAALFVFGFYINLMCWLFFLLLLFEFLKDFFKPRTAFLCTLIGMLIMGNTAGIFQVSTESIYMLFMALGLYFLRQYFKTNFFWQLSLALSFFITSCLIKPGSIFLAIILTLFFGIKILKKYQSKAIYFIYGSWLLVLMQCAGLKYQFGNFTISYIDAITYYCYLGAKAEAIETNQDFEKVWLERTHFIYNQDPPISKIMAKEDLIEQWQTNKINLGKAYFLNLLENASTGSTPIQDCKNITNKKYFIVSKKVLLGISVWQNIIFSIVAIFLATYLLLACYKSDPYYSIVSFFILYTIFSSGISCSEGDRFNVITFPFVLILMAKCFSKKSTEAAKIYTVR